MRHRSSPSSCSCPCSTMGSWPISLQVDTDRRAEGTRGPRGRLLWHLAARRRHGRWSLRGVVNCVRRTRTGSRREWQGNGASVSQPRGRRTSMKVGGHWTGQACVSTRHLRIVPFPHPSSLIPPTRILHTLDQTADPDPAAILSLPSVSSHQATISPTR